jgi:manganese transport protein
MPDHATDPYTVRSGDARPPPVSLRRRLRQLGPSVIVSGSVVGSGEIILTSSLGAVAGFALLWWVLVSCWSKSLVQAELSRYVIVSGDTYLRALNRLPGRLPGPREPIGWPLWLGLIAFVPGVLGLGGILGGAGQALALLVPGIDSLVGTGLVALVTVTFLASGTYVGLERVMLALVGAFTLATLVCTFTMQFTEYGVSAADLATGFAFDFPAPYLALALAVYGYTGVNSGEIAAYTYWCVEKGYPSYVGADRDDPAWLERARGWVKVMQTDVWLGLLILTCATLPFYVLGAGVLHAIGARPNGLETISALSNMFTHTLGNWAVWLFGIGAFFILLSTALSAIAAGGRLLPDYIIELGFFDRVHVTLRRSLTRGYVVVVPLIAFAIYLTVQNPVLLVTIGGLIGASLLPIQSGATLWLQARHMDPRMRPGSGVRAALWTTLIFQLAMAWLVVRYVVFG